MNLPYIIPDKSLELNLGVLLLVICHLEKTKRGRLLINNETAHVFFCLVKNPALMNRFLCVFDKSGVALSDAESYSIASLSPDTASFYDRKALRGLLAILVDKELVRVTFISKKGFYYSSTEAGQKVAGELDSTYFLRIVDFLNELRGVQSEAPTSLTNALNRLLKAELI